MNEELEKKLLKGVDQLDRRQGIPAEKVIAELKKLSAKRRRNA
jgi:hypothetical protein